MAVRRACKQTTETNLQKNNCRKKKMKKKIMGNIYHSWCCCWRWWWCRCCCCQRCRRCRCCHYIQNCLNSHYWYSFRQCYTDPRRLVLASADDFWHLLGVALRIQWIKPKKNYFRLVPLDSLACNGKFVGYRCCNVARRAINQLSIFRRELIVTSTVDTTFFW